GRPLQNVTNSVVDDQLQLVPVGVPGELLIGGIGLARGYQNLPELTRAKFIDNPHGPGQVYRTGDRVRWLPEGTIEFLGRIDNQVKLRGFRIELEEIEQVAGCFTGLSNCAAKIIQNTLVLYTSPTSLDQESLKNFLSSRLSKQMVPQIIVPVTEFKLTANGKLDRDSLPPIDHLLKQHSTTDFEEHPLSGIESSLRQVWAQVLQKDPSQITATDHFFKIGGDSISAILLVSKFQQLGYQFMVPLVYQYPKLEQQAQYLQYETSTIADIGLAYQVQAKGDVPLTPIQHWFSKLPFKNPSHFNQSFSFKVDLHFPLSHPTLTDAIVSLLNHHDILRARFQLGDNGQSWIQLIPTEVATNTDFLVLEKTVDPDDYSAFILEVQSSLNLITGPVVAAALIHNPADLLSTQFFFTIHHILVDLVSWRILIEDLNSLLLSKPLPPKTMSFQTWATQLADYCSTLSADIWPTQMDPNHPIPDIYSLLPPPEISIEDYPVARLSVSLDFDAKSTNTLIFQLAPQWRVTPQDLLLATFAHAFSTTIGVNQISLCMEGHGREPWAADQNITRTVGWFTSPYPLVLRIQPGQSLLELLQHTKEALQTIPGKGFIYSVIKYMPGVNTDERCKLIAKIPERMDVQFNYFGQFTNSGTPQSGDPLSIEWSNSFGLHDFSSQDFVIFDLNPMPAIVDNSLRLIMEYNPRVYHQDIISRIMAKWHHNLAELTSLGVQSENIISEPLLTKYDFPHLSLSDTGFQTVLAQVHQRDIPLAQVEDIFPCIAVQGGLLMNLSSDPSMYLVQMAMKLTGQLDCDQLIQAWASVANQHSPLRTVFIESPSTLSQGFLQVVLSSLPTSWTIAVQPLDSLETFFIENRQQGFTLQEHMVRNFVFPTADSQVYDIIITIHHSLMDGWSLPLLLQQWMVAYHNPKLAVSPPPTSFTAVVRYICQSDPTLAQAFWTDYLHNAKATPAPLLYPDYIGSPGQVLRTSLT
ncbi:condensation domain-containing protein, partial [Dimargaris cristalligena]